MMCAPLSCCTRARTLSIRAINPESCILWTRDLQNCILSRIESSTEDRLLRNGQASGLDLSPDAEKPRPSQTHTHTHTHTNQTEAIEPTFAVPCPVSPHLRASS